MITLENSVLLILSITFFYFLQKPIQAFIYKITLPTSDHGYHVGLVNSIRNNKHRFVNGHCNYIENKNFMYPQFFHWVLSFLSPYTVSKSFSKINSVLNLAIIGFLFLYPILLIPSLLNKEVFLIYGSLIVFTPFSYFLWNAKNRGLSARSIGLLIVYMHQFVLIQYFISKHNIFLMILIAIAFLAIISNQFSTQYILLSAPFYALLFKFWFILVTPLLGFSIFWITMPSVAKNYIKGQYWHKYMFSKYLSKVYYLNRRASIWRDLVWDIWKKKDLKYTLGNAVISILIGFPTIVLVVILLPYAKNNLDFFDQKIVVFLKMGLVPLAVFVTTSFRKTRFLGEPERYVEFGLPFYVLLATLIILKIGIVFVLLLVLISLAIILYHFILYGFNQFDNSTITIIDSFKNAIKRELGDGENCRLFSNNTDYLHNFIDEPLFNILMPNITALTTGKYHFKEICPKDYGIINNEIIADLCITFNINYFVLEKERNDENVLEHPHIQKHKVAESPYLSLYKLTYL